MNDYQVQQQQQPQQQNDQKIMSEKRNSKDDLSVNNTVIQDFYNGTNIFITGGTGNKAFADF
jgi:hypothetical protein